MTHEWKPSFLGHGELQCINCLCTNREAWVLGDVCPGKAETKPKLRIVGGTDHRGDQ